MRILLLTPLFQPEPNHLKGLAFARELRRQGHEVEVLTGFPNYPGGRIYAGYRMRWHQCEILDGVAVHRLPLYPSHGNSGVLRFLCYASFAASASVLGPFLVKKPDVVHVYQGPATLVWPALIFRCLSSAAYVLDVQDIWPESVVSSGMFRLPGGEFLLHRWSNHSYRLARKIVVLSQGYKTLLMQRGVSAEKIAVVHNWTDETQIQIEESTTVTDDRFGLSGHFNIMFAGNLGRIQGLDTVLSAAELLRAKRPEARFVFVGEGVDAERLKDLATRRRLENVKFIPRQPVSQMGGIFTRASALLIHLKDDPLSRMGIPQKTQAYLAAGRPIIMAVRGDAADLVRRAGAGIICEPENAAGIARAVEELLDMPTKQREALGANGRRFYQRELSFDIGVQRMISVFEEAAGNR